MNTENLNLTLADIEASLLRRKCDALEDIIDEQDDEGEGDAQVDEATVASDGAKISSQKAGGGAPSGPDAYAGYSVGSEGDRHLDGGGTRTADAERAETLRAAMHGGPGDNPPQTTDGKAAMARKYSRKDKDNQGDVDHSGHQSGAGSSSGSMKANRETPRMTY